MKRYFSTLILGIITTGLIAQNIPTPKPDDVSSLDNIIAALYDVISGPAGEKRDWDRMRSLFADEAKLIPTWKDENGKLQRRVWTVDQYVETAGANLEKNGFFEIETHRIVEQYGTITHIFSTYDSRRTLEDKDPFARGINSIQLISDDTRWWIVNIVWMGETEALPIPKQYLNNKERKKRKKNKRK